METCVKCGTDEGLLYHHISYEPEETMVLCRGCHRSEHNKLNKNGTPISKPHKHPKPLSFRPSSHYMVKRIKREAKKNDRSISYVINNMINWYYRNYTSIKDVK